MKNPRKSMTKMLGLACATAAVVLGTSVPAQRLMAFPHRVEATQGQEMALPWSRWLPLTISAGRAKPVLIAGARTIDLSTPRAGHYLLRLRLFWWIPWRGVPVDVAKPVYVVPGGESMGILAHTRGLVVTGFSPVYAHGRAVDPAIEAGIERGDVITQVDGEPASSLQILQQRIAQDGSHHRPVCLWVTGSRTNRQRTVVPVWSPYARHWHIGASVQDKTSGVGTLTFFNSATHRYTALGHSITDGVTRRPVALESGRVTGADIVGVVPATASQPGQKVGVLAGPTNVSGTARFNGMLGVVGHLDHTPVWGPQKSMPLAFPDQVRTGPAQIVTVISGQVPEFFNVEILKTATQYEPQVKGLLFKVTDPRLIRHTGGIIQGMSGSPIIQNGRVVGAVTHVLINRPTLGFGCYAYWMAEQASYRG